MSIGDREMKKRNKEIVRLRKSGWSISKIGEKFSLSRERIRQILLLFGIKGRVKKLKNSFIVDRPRKKLSTGSS